MQCVVAARGRYSARNVGGQCANAFGQPGGRREPPNKGTFAADVEIPHNPAPARLVHDRATPRAGPMQRVIPVRLAITAVASDWCDHATAPAVIHQSQGNLTWPGTATTGTPGAAAAAETAGTGPNGRRRTDQAPPSARPRPELTFPMTHPADHAVRDCQLRNIFLAWRPTI